MPPSVQFAALLDALPQHVWQADAQARLLWLNARLGAALRSPALPTPLREHLNAEDRAAFDAH